MISVSISDLQRNLKEVIIPRVKAGESIEVVDKKSGDVKFHIVPPNSDHAVIDWPPFFDRALELNNDDDVVMDALNSVREDRVL